MTALSTAAVLAFACPTLAQAATMRHAHTMRHGVGSPTSTTLSVTCPNAAAMRSDNHKGGTGGKNSVSNGS